MRRAAGLVLLAWFVGLWGRRFLRRVTGPSMLPTLRPGEVVLVLPTWLRQAATGDVVVAPDPRTPTRLTIKRVVGRTGDDLELRGDNPVASTDSRAYGPLPERSVAGVAVARLWPDPALLRTRDAGPRRAARGRRG